MPRSFRCGKALPFLVLVALACSSSVEPRAHVKLLVANGTCTSGQCTPLRILGFPRIQPRTPGGAWSLDLGVLTGPSACVTIPLSASFTVTGPSTGDTVVIRWTDADSLALGTWVTDEPTFPAYASTAAFVPANAAGWGVALPGMSAPTPAEACAP